MQPVSCVEGLYGEGRADTVPVAGARHSGMLWAEGMSRDGCMDGKPGRVSCCHQVFAGVLAVLETEDSALLVCLKADGQGYGCCESLCWCPLLMQWCSPNLPPQGTAWELSPGGLGAVRPLSIHRSKAQKIKNTAQAPACQPGLSLCLTNTSLPRLQLIFIFEPCGEYPWLKPCMRCTSLFCQV